MRDILRVYLFSSFLYPQDYTDFHEKKNNINIVSVHYWLRYTLIILISCVNLV